MKLGINRTVKKIVAAIIFAVVSSSVFAVEEYVSLIYKQIDAAFSEKSSDALDGILKDNINDKYYYLIENYAQKKIRRLILINEYDFAKETTLVVIDNNLDNVDAVEMYSLIIESYEIQKEAERKRELALQEEEERIERQMERARGSTEKTYVGASTADGKSVYLSAERDMNFTRYEWKGQVGLVNLGLISNPAESLMKYGIALNGSYEYSFVDYTIGADLFGGINFIELMNQETRTSFLIPFELDGRISLTQISRKLFFKVGFMDYITSTVTGADHFVTPILGVMIDKIQLGTMSLNAGFDWYPAHIFNGKDQLFAGGFNAAIEIPFKEFEKTKLYFSAGVKDKFIIGKDGTDNRLHMVLAVGGKNVVR